MDGTKKAEARLLCKICTKPFLLDLESYKLVKITMCEGCVEGEADKVLKQRAFYRGGKSLIVIEPFDESIQDVNYDLNKEM